MNKPPLVLLGSARPDGDTHKLVDLLFVENEIVKLDLLAYKIYPYSYPGQYPSDDQFLPVVQELLDHSILIFATPVYWYAMSGTMKTFFDRLTAIVTIQKQLGRQMKGKQMYLLAIGSEDELPAGFEVPFKQTAAYFKMQFNDSYYCRTKDLQALLGKECFLQSSYQ